MHREIKMVFGVLTVFCSLSLACKGASVFFNIGQAIGMGGGPIIPQYVDGAEFLMSATRLTPNNLRESTDSVQTGTFTFYGWTTSSTPISNAPNIEFSISPKVPLTLTNLEYSFFTGNWSDLWFGPTVLDVWASFDGFTNATLIAEHTIFNTKPWDPNGFYNNQSENMAVLGKIYPSNTLSIRFVARYPNAPRFEGAAGFVHVYNFNKDLKLYMAESGTPPSIVVQPESKVYQIGSTVNFNVSCNGTPPIQYQWFFNGQKLSCETNATLTISNATPSNVGVYYASITNIAGVTNTQAASLWLNDDSKCARVIEVYGPIGSNVVVRYTTNISVPINWEILGSVIVTNMPMRIVDPGSVDAPLRFYQTVPQ